MTLLIAWLLMDLLHMDGWWKLWAFIIWVGHILFHAETTKK